MEALPLMPAEQMARGGDVYFRIDNPLQIVNPPRKPQDALPPQMLAVPKVIWLTLIIPKLLITDILHLRATCFDLLVLVESDPNFKGFMATKVSSVEPSLLTAPNGILLLDYARGLDLFLIRALKKFPLFPRTAPTDAYRERFEALWSLRHLPGMDQTVIRQGCELYGVQMQSNPLQELASQQMHFQLSRPTLKFVTMFLTPIIVGLAAAWRYIQPSAWPTVRPATIPWVELTVPPLTWDQLPSFQAYSPFYYINTPPYMVSGWGNLSSQTLMAANNLTTVRRAVENLDLSYPIQGYMLSLAIPYLVFISWNCVRTLPGTKVAALPLASALDYYACARHGVLHKHPWKNRLWFGAKVIASAGLVTVLTFSILNYLDFANNPAAIFAPTYAHAVQAIRDSYRGHYVAYAPYLEGDLRNSPLDPFKWGIKWFGDNDLCPAIFNFTEFNNYTDVFRANNLMPNWTVSYPYLYANCFSIFRALEINKIVSAQTPVNILNRIYDFATVTRMPEIALTYTGYALPVLLPQLMIVVHLLYLFFIAVWR